MSARRLSHDWYDAPLPENVTVGEGSWVYSSFAFLHYVSTRPCGVRIGQETGIYAGTFFELGPDGEAVIGDYCAVVGAVICSNTRVEIHDYAFVAHEVVIADVPVATPPTVGVANADARCPSIVVGENAWIGARAVLLSGAHVGANAVVGAAAVVDFHVPPGAVAAGNPARIVRH